MKIEYNGMLMALNDALKFVSTKKLSLESKRNGDTKIIYCIILQNGAMYDISQKIWNSLTADDTTHQETINFINKYSNYLKSNTLKYDDFLKANKK